MSQLKPAFSVRIVVCDSYLTKPTPGFDVIYSDFRGADIKQVPILRIFGPTPEGFKACLHVHGVFPYFYVPCPTPNPEPQFLYQLAASIDKALNIALKQATSSNQHVYRITLVKGLPFYGFHSKDHLYLKVFLYNPGLIKQAVELCSNGAILGQSFQPHESHLNFTLQFFIDFNLFGMSNIDLQNVKFRNAGSFQNSNDPLQSFDEGSLKPESICHFEADCVASHIINRQRVGKGDGIENPGLEEVWNQEKERRKHLNVSISSKSLTQVRLKAEETESHYKFEQMFLVKLSNLIDKPVNTHLDIKKSEEGIYYPAESMEGLQLFKAVDVSMHVPENSLVTSLNETLKRDMSKTFHNDIDNTIVDESLALNSTLSLHYSQVQLDSDDLNLVNLLEDMDDEPVEEDSVLGTPAEIDREVSNDSDDAEYSQCFCDETILSDCYKSKDGGNESSPSWNDSFWNDANIPQLDGTCDDDHVKKVRKRKMRSFKLGLSRPKNKKQVKSDKADEVTTNERTDLNETDEINVSRKTIENISDNHLKRAIKMEVSILECPKPSNALNIVNESPKNTNSITDLVNKFSQKYEYDEEAAKTYDISKKYQPIAGPSTVSIKYDRDNIKSLCKSFNDSSDSSPEESNKDIVSFYNTSKIFDSSIEDQKMHNKSQESGNKESYNSSITIENTSKRNKSTELQSAEQEILSCVDKLKHDNSIILTPKIKPPTKNFITSGLKKYNIPKVKNLKPYYSDYKDVGDKVEIGQMVLKLQSKISRDQKPFDVFCNITTIEEWRQLLFLQTSEIYNDTTTKCKSLKCLLASNKDCTLQPLKKPPTKSNVVLWQKEKEKCVLNENKNDTTAAISNVLYDKDELDNSQAIGLVENEINSSISLESTEKSNITDTSLHVSMQPDGSFLCFGSVGNENEGTTPSLEVDFLTVMLSEVHTSVRGDLHPDPTIDSIQAVFLNITNDCPSEHFLTKNITEIIVQDNLTPPKLLDRCVNAHVTYVNDENSLLETIIALVKKHDPDIMCGYDIEMNSWGYIIERAQILEFEIVREISRITEKNRQKRWRSEESDFEGRIIGRITFNVWRLFRHELALSSYSFENCMYEILKERVPTYTYAQLAEWWADESRILRWIPVEYYLTRLSGTVRMLQKLDIINRTSELARLFGLQWWEVLSRGSQFRVESLMLRAARPLNLIALSPTVRQRAAMKAPECLPLIFEPESRFYSDPVIVLDFQSLYPSMMIAYNYCFSTCIGRVQNINGDTDYEFGAWRLKIPKSKLEVLVKNDMIHWSPVGVGFVKSSVRRGVLPALLRRILAARQAVKKGMKLQTDENIKKAMHSRQLGLKLIANVTYGYTAANFSGRMPCVEVGDSVVSKGRETLERAIKLVQNSNWNAKVVYGDTDSMFVLVPGGTRAEAFEIGQQIADAVTADNPSPVALKLEKVYQPCILQTKKRYVGYMYESPDQEKPVYEAKGIETVRRDGCPAGVKLLQRSLCELFESGDMSRVKRHVVALLSQLVNNTLPPQELFFTREYHGPNGYRPGAAAPPNEIAKRISSRDRRALPRAGERVSWLVCAGAPGAPLVKLARTPQELLKEPSLTPFVAYYAARVLLPPLHRCLSLLGVDVFKWWNELGYSRESEHSRAGQVGGIARYMWRERCAACGGRGARALCGGCASRPQPALVALASKLTNCHLHQRYCHTICTSCCGHSKTLQCVNTECPVLWKRIATKQKLSQVMDIVSHLPSPFTEESLDF